jgi:predicted esterase
VAKRQRLLVTHGRLDPLIPMAPVRDQVQKLKAAGLNAIWREFPKAHTIYGAEEINVIRDFIAQGYPPTTAPQAGTI